MRLAQRIYGFGRDIINHDWDSSELYQIQVTALNSMPENIQKDLFQGQEKDATVLIKLISRFLLSFLEDNLQSVISPQ